MRTSNRFALLLWLLAVNALASDPVPSDRLPYGGTFENIVGVSGGIPLTGRTQSGATLGTSSTAAQINTAIANAASGTYVLLASGTFNSLGNNDITIAKSGVTLRGAVDANGLPNTTLVFASGRQCFFRANTWDFSNSGQFTTRTVSSGATRGSTSLTLTAAPTGLATDLLMWISCPINAPTIDGDGWTDWFSAARPWTQAVKVTSVSGSVVSFTPAINADYLSGTIQVHYRTASDQISFSGFENLSLTNTTGEFSSSVCFQTEGVDQGWIYNCKAYGLQANDTLSAFVYLKQCYRFEIRRCDFSHFTAGAAGGGYGSSTYEMASVHCSGLLVEDNIFHDMPNVWPILATSGSAFAYNIVTNEPYQSPTFLSQIVFHHGSHNHYNLFEGNWCPTHYNDATSDGNFSHSRNSVYFRQRMLGWDGNGPKDGNCSCITLQNHHDNVVVAGCVMGHTGTQTTYQDNGGVGNMAIFNVDTVSASTLIRKKNYNTFNSAIPGAEALSGGEALITSYLHSSKPTWFGNLPWPWVDPDNFTQSNNATNFPAGYRFANNSDPPGGGGAVGTASGGVLGNGGLSGNAGLQ